MLQPKFLPILFYNGLTHFELITSRLVGLPELKSEQERKKEKKEKKEKKDKRREEKRGKREKEKKERICARE